MSTLQELTADTSHAFVRLVQDYKDEDRIGKEIARRQRVGTEQRSQWGTREKFGERSGMMAKEARDLVDAILKGDVVPDHTQNHNLAIRFGLDAEESGDFKDKGGEYLVHCMKRTAAIPKARYYEFPANESFGDALRAIMHIRRINIRGTGFLAPDEEGYDRLRSMSARRLQAVDPDFIQFVANGDSALRSKLNNLALQVYRNAIDPESALLTDEELARVSTNLRCTKAECYRLLIAYSHTAAEILYIGQPEIQDKIIHRALQAMDEGEYNHDGMGGAFTALHVMLMARGFPLNDPAIVEHWNTIKNREASPADRSESFDRLARTTGLEPIPGMDRFKEALLAEDIKRVEHVNVGMNKIAITEEILKKARRQRSTTSAAR